MKPSAKKILKKVLPRPVLIAGEFFIRKFSPVRMPAWLIDELAAIAQIDSNLKPTQKFLKSFVEVSIPLELLPGQIYARAYQALSQRKIDLIILIPALSNKNLLALELAQQLVAQANVKVLLISTDQSSRQQVQLASGIDHFDLGALLRPLNKPDKMLVLTRLLLQLNIERVQILNSALGLATLGVYGRALEQYVKIYKDFTLENMADLQAFYQF